MILAIVTTICFCPKYSANVPALTLVSLPSFMLPLQVPYTSSRSDKSVQMHHCSAGLGSEAAECAWDVALHSQPCLGAEQEL